MKPSALVSAVVLSGLLLLVLVLLYYAWKFSFDPSTFLLPGQPDYVFSAMLLLGAGFFAYLLYKISRGFVQNIREGDKPAHEVANYG